MKVTLFYCHKTGKFENLETGSLYSVSSVQALRAAGFDVDIEY